MKLKINSNVFHEKKEINQELKHIKFIITQPRFIHYYCYTFTCSIWKTRILLIYFCYFVNISHWYTYFFFYFIWTNLNPFLPKMLCTKFGLSCPVVWEKIFKKFFNVYLLFRYHFHGIGRGPTFEQTRISVLQVCLLQSLVEIRPLVLEQKNFVMSLLSPLGKWCGNSFEQTWIYFTQGFFVPGLVDIGPVVIEKKTKVWKCLRKQGRSRRRRQITDRFQSWLCLRLI